MITGKRNMAGWYIAPYYDSREQYLYGYYEDFSVREHLYNFGEVIDVAVEKRIKKQRAVYSGLHYFVRIEPGRSQEIRPENATYMAKQMMEMNEK